MLDTKKCLGIPYRRGGRDVRTGMDCYGFVCYARRVLGLPAPKAAVYDTSGILGSVKEIARQLPDWCEISQPDEGDIVLMRKDEYRPWHHVGIFTIPHHVIHAHEESACVIVTPINRLAEQYAEWSFVRCLS